MASRVDYAATVTSMRSLIRERFATTAPAAPTGDVAVSAVDPERPLTPAAVLVPLVDRPEGMTVLLTRRTPHLRDHGGQVSFPGGRVEEHDADWVATALRETVEEVGLTSDFVEVVGFLEDYTTITGFMVRPVVGIVTPEFSLIPDPFEVEEVFEVPLSHVLEPVNYRREQRLYRGILRGYYVLDYPGYFIWGATAAMLVCLRRRLTGH